jgi:hypothetical protein
MNYVNIELDKPRRIRFDVNALSDAEEALGMGLGTVMQSQLGIRMIRALLWAGLKWEDRGLTLERTGTLIQKYLENGGDLGALGETLTRALMVSGLFESSEGNSEAEAAQ